MALRFANKNTGTLDVHGPINILQPPINSLGETSGVVRIGSVSASLMAGPSTMSSSLSLSGNVNFNKLQQRDKYNRLLMGTAKRFEFGEAPDPGSNTPYANQLATSPTWTQSAVGLRHGFVSQAISSSNYEIQNLNAYFSGTDNLETSAVPASGNLYYSKQNRFRHVIYKLSASINLPDKPGNLTLCSTEEYGTRATGSNHFYQGSGSYRNNNINNPSVFEVFVPEYGKIRDIKVWVEFVHDRRCGFRPSTGSAFLLGGTGSYADDYAHHHGLQNIVIALKSPNVNFDFAHPLWNSKRLKEKFNNVISTGSIFRSSYLLWAGHFAEGISGISSSYQFSQASRFNYTFDVLPFYTIKNEATSSNRILHYGMYDTDIDMRTIFTDSSTTPNYRHTNYLYPNANINSLGGTVYSIADPNKGLLKNITGSSKLTNMRYSIPANSHVTGYNIPWMLDSRIPPGYLFGESYTTYNDFDGTAVTTPMSPPNGWYTNSINEFLTTGSNLGPETIKPFYPLLDDVYVKKINSVDIYRFFEQCDVSAVCTTAAGAAIPSEIIDLSSYDGMRPGLKGTEVHGVWKLLIGNADLGYGDSNYGIVSKNGYWFRNLRLEFILDQNPGSNNINNHGRKFNIGNSVPSKPGKNFLGIISGSYKGSELPYQAYSLNKNSLILTQPNFTIPLPTKEPLDLGVNIIYTNVAEEYGRSYGITDNTGSDYTNYAVFTRITGTLAERLTGSGQGALHAYLHNEFGTPYIPISSGSGNIRDIGNINELAKQKAMVSELLLQKPAIKQSQTLQAVLSRNNYFETLSQKRERLLSELNTYEEEDFEGELSAQLLGYFNK